MSYLPAVLHIGSALKSDETRQTERQQQNRSSGDNKSDAQTKRLGKRYLFFKDNPSNGSVPLSFHGVMDLEARVYKAIHKHIINIDTYNSIYAFITSSTCKCIYTCICVVRVR